MSRFPKLNRAATTVAVLTTLAFAGVARGAPDRAATSDIASELSRAAEEALADRCDLNAIDCVSHTLLRRAELDQFARRRLREAGCFPGPGGAGCADAAAVLRKIDSENAMIVDEIVTREGWPSLPKFTFEAESAAWLLVQHADHDPAFQTRALAHLSEASAADSRFSYQVAYLADRIAIHAGEMQNYGTQGRCDAGAWKPFPIADVGELDARRDRMGLGSYEQYLSTTKALCGR